MNGKVLAVEPAVVASPLKQEILRLNEENYYLKLEVIRLVSSLKQQQQQQQGPEQQDETQQGDGGRPHSAKRRRLVTPESDNDSDCFALMNIPAELEAEPETEPTLAALVDHDHDQGSLLDTGLQLRLDLSTPEPHAADDFLFLDNSDVDNAFAAFTT